MGPLIGPRNSIVRTLMGEDVPMEDWVTDKSELSIQSSGISQKYRSRASTNVHDHVGGVE